MKNLLDIFGEHPNWTNSEPDNIPWKEMDSAADEYVQNLLAVGNRWKNIVAYDIEGYQGYEIKFHFKSDKEKKEYEYQQFLEKLTKRHFLSSVFNSLERFGFNVSEINLSPNDIKEWFSEDDILTYGLDSSTPEQTPVINEAGTMRQTMLEIIDRHFSEWFYIYDPSDFQKYHTIDEEIGNEADCYVQKLSQYGERWRVIIERDLKELCQHLEPLNDFINHTEWQNEHKKKRDFVACTFITAIRESLFRYGYDYQTELTPQSLLALIYFRWPKDEEELNSMKKHVADYVVEIDGVKVFADTSTPTPEQTPLDKLLEEWNQGRPKRILMLLKKKGFITNNGDVYNWKIDNKNDYPNNLYVYFVYVASEKFEWRKGKDKQIVPWMKFNPIFPNMAENQKAMDQYLREIKKNVFPRRKSEIDSLFNW